jgi:hypothetical protein
VIPIELVLGLAPGNVPVRALSSALAALTALMPGLFGYHIIFVARKSQPTIGAPTVQNSRLRECLYGLDFEYNRFDFDFEVTSKLLRKGSRALELPVNYRALSFSEGKKVTVVRATH